MGSDLGDIEMHTPTVSAGRSTSIFEVLMNSAFRKHVLLQTYFKRFFSVRRVIFSVYGSHLYILDWIRRMSIHCSPILEKKLPKTDSFKFSMVCIIRLHEMKCGSRWLEDPWESDISLFSIWMSEVVDRSSSMTLSAKEYSVKNTLLITKDLCVDP